MIALILRDIRIAARAGGGIAMGHRLLLRDLIAREELMCPFELSINAKHRYFVVTSSNAAHLDYVKRFRDWLTKSFCEEDMPLG